MSAEKKKIVVNKFNDVLNFVNESFAKVLVLLNENGIITEEKIKKSFDNQKELEDFLEGFVVDYLNEKYSDLHSRISKARKAGLKLTELSLKLSTFKFKLRLFKARHDKHSFNKVILILNKVENELNKILSDNNAPAK